MGIDDYLLDTSHIDNITTDLNTAGLTGLSQKKSVNLYERSQAKQKRLGTTKDTFTPADSLAYDYQDTANTLKSAWNFVAPSEYEFDQYELDKEGEDKGNLYLLGDQGQRISQLQEDTTTGELASIRGNDGDTFGGVRTTKIDTPESEWMGAEDSKFQRIKNEFGVSDQDQIKAGKNALKFGEDWLSKNQGTEATVTGTDVFNRTLAESDEYNKAIVGAGYATPSQDASPELWKLYQNAKDKKLGNFSKENNLGYVMDAMELDASEFNDNRIAQEDTFEFVDAFQSASIKLAGDVVKTIGEVVDGGRVGPDGKNVDGSIEALGKRMNEKADEWSGYNPRSVRKAEIKLSSAKAKLERGDVIGGFGDFVSGAWTGGPQVLAQSIPELAAMAGTAAGTVAAIGAAPVTGFIAGVVAMGAVKTNDALDEREKLNNGKKATFEEVTAVTGAQMLKTAFDYGAFKFITMPTGKIGVLFKGAKESTPLEEALKLTSKTRKKEFVKALGTLTAGGATEVVQEITSETVDQISRQLGTEKFEGDSALDIVKRMEEEDTFIKTAGLSFGAGTAFALPNTVKGLNKGLKDAGKVDELRAQSSNVVSEESQELEDLSIEDREKNLNQVDELTRSVLSNLEDGTELTNEEHQDWLNKLQNDAVREDSAAVVDTMSQITATEEGATQVRTALDEIGVPNEFAQITEMAVQGNTTAIEIVTTVAQKIDKANPERIALKKLEATRADRIKDVVKSHVDTTKTQLTELEAEKLVIKEVRPKAIDSDRTAAERAELKEAQAEGNVEAESEISQTIAEKGTRSAKAIAAKLVSTDKSKDLLGYVSEAKALLNTKELKDLIKRVESKSADNAIEGEAVITDKKRKKIVAQLNKIVEARDRAEQNVRVVGTDSLAGAKKIADNIGKGQKSTVKIVQSMTDNKVFDAILDGKTPTQWIEDIKLNAKDDLVYLEAITRHPELVSDTEAHRNYAPTREALDKLAKAGKKPTTDTEVKKVLSELRSIQLARTETPLGSNKIATGDYAKLRAAVVATHKATEATADEISGMEQMAETALNNKVITKQQSDRLAKLRSKMTVVEEAKPEKKAEKAETTTEEPTDTEIEVGEESELDEGYKDQELKGVDVEAMTQLELATLAKELGIKVC